MFPNANRNIVINKAVDKGTRNVSIRDFSREENQRHSDEEERAGLSYEENDIDDNQNIIIYEMDQRDSDEEGIEVSSARDDEK